MIHFIGYPSDVGGANTEAWHLLKLWRDAGWQVSAYPTWKADPKWQTKLARIGIPTIPPDRRELQVPADSTCVALCNGHFEQQAHKLREKGCRLIYSPCMCYLGKSLIRDHEEHGPFNNYTFQSWTQLDILLPQLLQFGVKPSQCRVIRGAFDWSDFEYQPRQRSEGFIVGRVSRADPAKFSRYTWDILARARRQVPDLQARILGWRERVQQQIGLAPSWGETLKPNSEPVATFLASLHCLCQANDNQPENPGTIENWPRVGLEAMASGVPIVADKRGGWLEMIEHGNTGLLGATVEELAENCVALAHDDNQRLRMVEKAYVRVKQLSEPSELTSAWRTFLGDAAS